MDIVELKNRCSQGEQFEYLYFWGHQDSKNGIVNSSCLSQWYPSNFIIDNISYPTAEHWMMACKARLFSDDQSLDLILNSNDPKTAKSLGRKVKNFDAEIWSNNCRSLVGRGNYEKFKQNKLLLDFLLDTGNKVLVEASPYDKIWGIGLNAQDERSKDPNTWNGTNLLGFVLMLVRRRIRYENLAKDINESFEI
jgi:hypothetical protein